MEHTKYFERLIVLHPEAVDEDNPVEIKVACQVDWPYKCGNITTTTDVELKNENAQCDVCRRWLDCFSCGAYLEGLGFNNHKQTRVEYLDGIGFAYGQVTIDYDDNLLFCASCGWSYRKGMEIGIQEYSD